MSKKMSRYPNDCKVYVGELGNSARKNDLEDSFSYYGPLRNVWVARNPPGFAFVEFEDARDAEDAVRGLDGRTICGRRARVELSNGKSGRGFRGPPSRSRGRPFDPADRCYECGDRGHYARDCRKHGRSRRRCPPCQFNKLPIVHRMNRVRVSHVHAAVVVPAVETIEHDHVQPDHIHAVDPDPDLDDHDPVTIHVTHVMVTIIPNRLHLGRTVTEE
ncbi:Serine/arginine-rich splicing factor 7, partial [Pseudolycoriella hygida]